MIFFLLHMNNGIIEVVYLECKDKFNQNKFTKIMYYI